MGRSPGFTASVTGQAQCRACGRDIVTYAAGPARKWCSAACGAWARRYPGETRPADWAPYKRLPKKTCPRCKVAFHPRQHNIKYCTRECAYAAQSEQAAALRADLPTECSEPGCTNLRRRGGRKIRPWCRDCEEAKWPRDAEKERARFRRHTHLRKALTKRVDLPIEEERRMRAAAKCCPLCRVKLVDHPYQPASKELDHIVPLNVGGAHSIFNVRIICRACNLRRPKDGSDVAALPLFSLEVA